MMINHVLRLAKFSILPVLAGSLAAVELPAPDAPPAPDPDVPEARAEAQAEVQLQVDAPGQAPADNQEAGGGSAYLGVGGTEVPELLATHLGLKAGEGVVVRTLDPNGPAAAIGVEESDVVLRVAGAVVGSQNELRDAILEHDSGDEVELDLIQQGKPLKKRVKLGERPLIPDAAMPQLDPMIEGMPEGQAKRVREAIEQNLRALEGLQMPELQQGPAGMKQLEKRLELMFRGLGDAGGGMQLEGSSKIRMQDPEGSVEMESGDGSKQMRVRDNDGEIQWEGPWDTPQDKAAAPDGIRERIERLDLDVIEDGDHGGFRLQIGPGMGGMKIEPRLKDD